MGARPIHISMSICARKALIALAFSVAVFSAPAARADTVASLLGNFTINQFSGLTLAQNTVELHYVVVFGQLPALAQLHAADANHDGVTSQQERDDYVGEMAQSFAQSLQVRVDGTLVALRAIRWLSALPTESGGFSLRVDVFYRGELPSTAGNAPRTLDFTNQNFPDRIGWNEIALEHAPGLTVFDTNAYANSLTAALADALTSLPADGPLRERSVHAQWADHAPAGATPIAARPIAARPGTGAAPVGALTKPQSSASKEAAWIAEKTHAMVEAISAPRLAPGVVVLTLLGAVLLGAVHALSPGHGKTIVGAYLIGSRGTPRHAVFLGLTVTITHTLGVFALGLLTLYAAQFLAPEKLVPLLNVGSGLLVLGMGCIMLWRRIAAARAPTFVAVAPSAVAPGAVAPGAVAPIAPAPTAGIYRQPYVSTAAGMHSHGGGPMHSHLPPGASGEKVTWRSLLALGISGGLVPCPSAMVLLLAAVALNKTAFGMVLVTAFSVGLAITLTAVGLVFLWARSRLPRARIGSRWSQLLPVLSAAVITLVGVFLCLGAMQGLTFGS